jgi:hypothetical protein
MYCPCSFDPDLSARQARLSLLSFERRAVGEPSLTLASMDTPKSPSRKSLNSPCVRHSSPRQRASAGSRRRHWEAAARGPPLSHRPDWILRDELRRPRLGVARGRRGTRRRNPHTRERVVSLDPSPVGLPRRGKRGRGPGAPAAWPRRADRVILHTRAPLSPSLVRGRHRVSSLCAVLGDPPR